MKRAIGSIVLSVLLTVLLTSCGSKTPPTPFANVYWGDSEETALTAIGKTPTTEYDEGGIHYVSFENYTYEGLIGELVLEFENHSLYSVRYVLPTYDENAFNSFTEMFDKKYKSASESVALGKMWKSKDSMITLIGVTMGVGRVVVVFADLSR